MPCSSFITGTGLVTALGADVPSTWRAMLDGGFINSHASAKLDPTHGRASRVSRLAAQAAREAVASAGWSTDLLHDPETAIVFGTSKGDITEWIAPDTRSENHSTNEWNDSSFGIGKACDDLCVLLGHPAGARLTVSAACASGLQALIRADLLLKSDAAKRVLVVAAEASVHPLFLASFARLGVLATGDDPGRPFDQNRTGFRMSEAAAAVTLELRNGSESDINMRLVVTAMAGDASNIVAGNPHNRVLRRMLGQMFAHGPIDVIHAHGTGTRLNDQLEAGAINSVARQFGSRPTLYSHKGSLGHSLGASGLVSVVIAASAHCTCCIPTMATTITPMTLTSAALSTSTSRGRFRSSVVLANGFGGPQSAVLLHSEV